ncbi:MAG TPA: hypothetical protein VM140_01110 [Burkholderiales bacterium]|nr:hypothetical protein [Burkholderiales bacterium]
MTADAKRMALGALCLAYVPFLGWISLVTTPAYVTWPMLSAFVPPVAFASLAFGLLVSRRAARATALIAACILAVWLLENVGSVFWRIVDWEREVGASLGDALVGALEQSVPRAPYWLAVVVPLCVAGSYLYLARRQ